MLNMYLVDEIIRRALAEDVGTGDITTLSTVPKEKRISGSLIAKEGGVICGLPVLARVFHHTDPSIEVAFLAARRQFKRRGHARISGPAGVLTGEGRRSTFFRECPASRRAQESALTP
jgi:nicotinate-nucleotide pyrophosphorylase (carboxylating)